MAEGERKRWDFGAPDMEKLLGETAEYKGESLWQDAWRRLRRNRSAFWSMVFLVLFGAMSFFAPLLPLASPVALSLRTEASPPSWPWQSPPATTDETPSGAAITSSFGAVMDNGWRHRSVASFEVSGGTIDDVSTALTGLVEEVSGRDPIIDRRTIPGDQGLTAFHLAVPFAWDDPAHTDWEPTGLEATGHLLLIGDDAAWLDVTLPEGAEDPGSFDSWSAQTSDLDGSLTLRASGDRLLRYAFRLERPFTGTFDGLTVNGHWAPAIGRTDEHGPLGVEAVVDEPEAEEEPAATDEGEAEQDEEADSPTTTAEHRAAFLAGVATEATELLAGDEDQRLVAESRGKRKVLYDSYELDLVEESGIVHEDLERRLNAAMAGFTAPAGSEVALTEINLEDGYPWELFWWDYPMISLRSKIFGTWQNGNWLGTDSKGRDILARIVWGSRTSIIVALVATLCSLMIGVTYGAFSGLMGGRIDNLMMRIVDILYSLPFIFVVIFLITILNEYKVELEDRFGLDRELVFYLVIGAIYWLTMAGFVRGMVLSLKNSEFIEASRVIGASTGRILFAHLVPNVLSIVIVYLTLTIPAVMLFEAFLTFLGLGIEPPKVSWGTLAVDGTEAVNPVRIYWWLVLDPAAAMGSTLLALNVLGDGLRDALDPKLRGKD